MTLFTDFVQGPGATSAAVANKVALSNLTLPQSARMITRIRVTATVVGTFAADKLLSGYVVVDSEDCSIAPLNIPIMPVASYVTLGNAAADEAPFWIVNCPCPGGTVLSFDVVADVAPNGAPEVQVTVEFSDGGSPFGAPQLHMKIGEPAVAMSTADNGELSLTNIKVKASQLLLLFGYVAMTAGIAESSVAATGEFTSDDFAVAGPHRFAFEPQVGGKANLVGSTAHLTKLPQDVPFRVPGQEQTLSCAVTMRDAVSTAPLANWGVVYS